MLRSTFCHLPGIGETIERNLWSAGVTSWDTAVEPDAVRLPRRLKKSWADHLRRSIENYERRDLVYFAETLPTNQLWRLYRDFRDACAFVDIETTGLCAWDEITTAVLYDGRSVRYYVNGDNLSDFPRDLKEYRLLVTYNGTQFDVPFIERFFHIRLTQAHIDLRYPLWTLGLKGGLKRCEQRLGITRPGLDNVDGFTAVLLWNEYRMRKSVKALETLLAYNMRDTINLCALMVHVYNAKVKGMPFASSHSLPRPILPEPSLQVDPGTLRRVLNLNFGTLSGSSSSTLTPTT
jgi:uncharacterized protein YprB with RNaseH-like and TPR domain